MPSAAAVRQADLAWVLDRYDALARFGQGSIAIVDGPPGSGRSDLIRSAASVLRLRRPTPVIIGGALRRDSAGGLVYVPWDHQTDSSVLYAAWEAAEGAAQLTGVVVPFLTLAAQLSNATRTAAALSEQLRRAGLGTEPLSGLARMLRDVAADRECVVLIDDVDYASALWRDLHMTLAREIASDLHLLLVLVTRRPRESREHQTESAALVDSLVQRGLAARRTIEPFQLADVREWLGPADPEIATDLLEVTWGRARVLADAWGEWVRLGVVVRAADDAPWEYSRATDSCGVPSAADAARRLLEEAAGHVVAETWGHINDVLACGALAGETFLAGPVARTLGLNLNYVVWILNELLARETADGHAILEARGDESSPGLRSYNFRSLWHWLGFRNDALARPTLESWAAMLAEEMGRSLGDRAYGSADRIADLLVLAAQPERATLARQAFEKGQPEELLARVRHFLAIAPSLIDPWECRRAAEFLNDIHGLGMPWPEYVATPRVALTLAQRAGDGPNQCRALLQMANVSIAEEDLPDALGQASDGLRIAEDVPYQYGIGYAHEKLAKVLGLMGRDDEMEAHANDALAVFLTLGHPHGEMVSRRLLGAIWEHNAAGSESATGADQCRRRAYDEYVRAFTIAAEVLGVDGNAASTAIALGHLAVELGRPDAAYQHHVAALQIVSAGMRIDPRAVDRLAALADVLGDGETAARIRSDRTLVFERHEPDAAAPAT